MTKEKFKNNAEAGKAYADLLYRELNDDQRKLQHEAACLDFAAGAKWKEDELSLKPVVSERDEKILYWAKQLEHKPLSVHELVENAKWLLDHVK